MKRFVLGFISMDRCGHCQTFKKGEWVLLQEALKDSDIRLEEINQRDVDRASGLGYMCVWFPQIFATAVEEFDGWQKKKTVWAKFMDGDVMWDVNAETGERVPKMVSMKAQFPRTREGVMQWLDSVKPLIEERFAAAAVAAPSPSPSSSHSIAQPLASSTKSLLRMHTPSSTVRRTEPNTPATTSQTPSTTSSSSASSSNKPTFKTPSSAERDNYENIGRFKWQITVDGQGNILDCKRL
jgi:hypothetical protein